MTADWRTEYNYHVYGKAEATEVNALAKASELYIGHTAVIALGGPGELVQELGKKRLGLEEFGYALCYDDPEDEAALRSQAQQLIRRWTKERLQAQLEENL